MALRRRRHSAALAESGNVVSLGSFSKILAPGLRLGWIQANPELMQRMLAQGALVSGGNFNHFASHVVRQLMENGELASFVEHLRASYAARAEAMDAALRTHLGGVASWQKPLGGYFLWLRLPDGRRRREIPGRGRRGGHRIPSRNRPVPRPVCLNDCLRLSFAHYTVPDIHDGIARLGRALNA